MIKKKGAIQISFSWLFAIIVGIVILTLAIYAVVKGVSTSEMSQTAQAGKELSVLFNSLESGFESGQFSSFSIPSESRIYNGCDNFGKFGTQIISLEQKNFGKFTKTNMEISSKNLYLFSEKFVQGKNFYVFSKSLEMPFEIATLNYFTSAEEKYCFEEVEEEAEDVAQEIFNLKQPNLVFGPCSGNEIVVCFGNYGSNCDIKVHYDLGYLEKDGEEIYFGNDALLYAAIFSDKEVYECQLKRLMKRLESLISIYEEKVIFLSDRCGTEMSSSLISMENSLESFESSENLLEIISTSEYLENKNRQVLCRLW